MKRYHRAGYTVEAAIWIPVMVFLVMGVIWLGIELWKKGNMRRVNEKLLNQDIVQEFYNYQALQEVGEELKND